MPGTNTLIRCSDTWLFPSPDLTGAQLHVDEIHVWRAALDQSLQQTTYFASLLAADEQQHAMRFHFARDRNRYCVGRGVLRTLLGWYLGVVPQALRFAYNDYGKPTIASPANDQNLQFNVSHSHGVALYAVTHNRSIGVDIERVRSDLNTTAIAEKVFSPVEQATLAELPPQLRQRAFFHCWTRKEAYIKAHGLGLSLPLNQFAVSFNPGMPAMLIEDKCHSSTKCCWTLYNLEPGGDYIAALAVQGGDCHLRCWQYSVAVPLP